jgi:phosphoribosylformylglycinamidine cyclo-ligase
VAEQEMYRTLNMGIGMVVVSRADDARRMRAHFDRLGEASYEIGTVVAGPRTVTLKH